MGLEVGTFVNDLVITNPPGTDPILQGDDHLRLIKTALKNTLLNADKAFAFPDAITKTAAYPVVKADINKFFQGDATAGAFSFTLPTLVAADDGWYAVFVKSDTSANAVTLVGTINGATNLILKPQYQGALVWWTGTAWLATLFVKPGDIISQAITVGGTVDAITLAFAPVFIEHATGMKIRWISAGSNTATDPTVAIDAIGGTKTLKKGANTALAIGDTGASGAVNEAVYNGTNYILLNPVSGLGNGRRAYYIEAASFVTRTTNGASLGVVEMATNDNMVRSFDFDPTTEQAIQTRFPLPSGWDKGTVSFKPVWSHNGGASFGVAWALQGVSIANDEAMDVAFGTQQTSVDTGGTTDKKYIGPESSAITIGGTPATGEVIDWQLKRVPGDAGDTLTVNARFHGMWLYYSISTEVEA